MNGTRRCCGFVNESILYAGEGSSWTEIASLRTVPRWRLVAMHPLEFAAVHSYATVRLDLLARQPNLSCALRSRMNFPDAAWKIYFPSGVNFQNVETTPFRL